MIPKARYRLIYDRKKLKKEKNLVQIEVYFMRARKYISTGVYLKSSQWKDRVVNHDRADELNFFLAAKIKELEDFEYSLLKGGEDFDLTKLSRHLKKENTGSFIDFIKKEMSTGVSVATYRQRSAMLNRVKEFGKIEYFTDLTPDNLRELDNFLRERVNSASQYHLFLKVYINKALKLDLLDKDPYRALSIAKDRQKDIRFLTVEEVSHIASVTLDDNLIKSRDVFIFSCFTGIAASDIPLITRKNIFRQDGDHWIRGRRKKSGKEYNIMLLPVPLDILKKYNYSLDISYHRLYGNLKKIATACGIDKLTFHMARHTFIVMMLNMDVPVEVVSEMVGHTNIKTTFHVYGKILRPTIKKHLTEIARRLSSS